MFKAVLKQFTILLPLFALKVVFSTGDIILLASYNQTVAWPYGTMLCIFFEKGFLKKEN